MVDVPRAHGLAVWLRFRSQHGANKGERALVTNVVEVVVSRTR